MRQISKQSAIEPAKPHDEGDPLKALAGSDQDDFNSSLLKRTMSCMMANPHAVGTPEYAEAETFKRGVAVGALMDFKPTDAIEGMLAAQAVAMHFAAMDCFRRSMLPNQPFEMATRQRKDGANLARGMADMVEALDRKRGKGQQHIRVERVVVQDGGQAVVGNVQTDSRRLGSGAPPMAALEHESAPAEIEIVEPRRRKTGGRGSR